MKAALERVAIFSIATSIIICGLIIASHGYGDNHDNYTILRSWQVARIDGRYMSSRYQGNIPTELVSGYLASIFGPWGSNSLSIFLSLTSAILLYKLLNHFVSNSRLVIAALFVAFANPYWINASFTTMDYVHPIPFYLFGILLMLKSFDTASIIVFAIAGAIRISFFPLDILTVLLISYRIKHDDLGEIAEKILSLVMVTGIFYIPVFISNHLTLDFLTSMRPTAQGYFGLIARFFYKSISLLGVLGSLATLMIFLWYGRLNGFLRSKSNRSPEQQFFFELIAIIILYHAALFLYIPERVEYLFPVLLSISALLCVWRVNKSLLYGLTALQIIYWFSAIDLLELIRPPGLLCDGYVTIDAKIRPRFGPGILSDRLNDQTGEAACFTPLLPIPPAAIADPLPDGRPREPAPSPE